MIVKWTVPVGRYIRAIEVGFLNIEAENYSEAIEKVLQMEDEEISKIVGSDSDEVLSKWKVDET